MNKRLLLLWCLLAASQPLFCQKYTEDFTLFPPSGRTSNSLYRTIRLLDSRVDTSNMGYVYISQRNKEKKVMSVPAFSKQLSGLMDSLTDASAGSGELLLQLRRLKFSQMTVTKKEFGYCYFRAALYARRDSSYQLLRFMDTVIFITGKETIPRLFKSTSAVIAEFIQNGLTLQPSGTAYTTQQLAKIDSLEKRKIPVYNVTEYKDGIYNTYHSFTNQLPDNPVEARLKRGELADVLITGKDGGQEVSRDKVYAVVFEGRPYIASEYGYYPLLRVDDNFYYAGNLKIASDARHLVLSGATSELIGTVIPVSKVRAEFFEVKIDHITGMPIPMMNATR